MISVLPQLAIIEPAGPWIEPHPARAKGQPTCVKADGDAAAPDSNSAGHVPKDFINGPRQRGTVRFGPVGVAAAAGFRLSALRSYDAQSL
jgi:hypothetical protein